MTALVDRLLPLWTRPVRARDDPRAAFAEVYADPVVVNGTAMTITELVDRARSLQQAFDRLGMDIVDTVEAPGRIVIAFIMRGRHVGPYRSPLGTVAPTHRDIEVRTIDVLTVSNGLISAIWVVSDDLALLRQLGAARLTPARHPGLLIRDVPPYWYGSPPAQSPGWAREPSARTMPDLGTSTRVDVGFVPNLA